VNRRILLGALAAIAALAAIWGAVVYVLDRDRDAATRELATERLQLLTTTAGTFATSLDGVRKDLTLAATLRESDLRAMLAVKQQYAALEVTTMADVTHIDGGLDEAVRLLAGPAFYRMRDTARRTPGELHISPGLSDSDDLAAWYRVFAIQPPGSSTVAQCLVDMRVLVAPPEVLRVGPSRLLVMSAHGVPAPASDTEITKALRTEVEAGVLHQLLDAAHAGRATTQMVAAHDAEQFGLPSAPAIAAAAPIRIDAGTPWVLVLVSSTQSLDARHAALVRRLAIDIAIGALLVLVTGAYIVRNARRAAALREELRHAEVLGRLTEKLLRTEKLATAGQFAAGIAHEIGSPLGVARGRAEMILLRGHADETDTKNVRAIVDRIDHVSKLIPQLLDYLRPNPSQMLQVDAKESLNLVADLLLPQARLRKIDIDVRVDAAISLRADPGQLQQVLVNLVMNAIDACEDGGRVMLSAARRGDGVALEVTDDGRGIAQEDRAHVFDPFFTTKKRGKGTGLGLWVVAQIARSHDAEIELDTSSSGTTVRLIWPVQERAA
jgi:signal transduction histidine kinase